MQKVFMQLSKLKKRKSSITERDLQILKFIGCEMGFALTSHIAIKFFPNRKVASRRLKALCENGLLFHIERATNRVGRSEYVFYLSERGKEVIKGKFNESILNISLKELNHTLLANEFIMAIDKDLLKKDLRFKYMKDVHLRDASIFEEYLKENGNLLKVMFPDIVFCLSNNENKKILFFVEVERGTISINSDKSTSIIEKVEVMSEYFDHYVYKFFNEVFNFDFQGFRYLIVTSGNEKRIRKIREQTDKLNQDTGFVWITTSNQISDKGVFNKIWSKADIKENELHSIA